MKRVVLGVTGSVAAIRVPALHSELASRGFEVRVVATEPSLYFFDPAELAARGGRVWRDADEWPGDRYRRDDPVLHIELRRWADLLAVAPLDAKTLAKFALGISDNLLTCLFRAWDFSRPVILAPAMNTLMWESPVTLRHLAQILMDRSGFCALPADWSLETASAHFVQSCPSIVLVPPESRRLACGDVGAGAMAQVQAIIDTIADWGREC